MVRSIRIDGDIAYIPLTQGKVAIIDAVDVPLVKGRNWSATKRKNTFYARATKPRVDGRQTMEFLHRFLMQAAPDIEVDHEDCDGLNCRRSNMRAATRYQNSLNIPRLSKNTSGHKGVHWNKAKSLWVARINVERRKIHLGFFSDIEAASAAYAEASKRHHGEFGRLS